GEPGDFTLDDMETPERGVDDAEAGVEHPKEDDGNHHARYSPGQQHQAAQPAAAGKGVIEQEGDAQSDQEARNDRADRIAEGPEDGEPSAVVAQDDLEIGEAPVLGADLQEIHAGAFAE